MKCTVTPHIFLFKGQHIMLSSSLCEGILVSDICSRCLPLWIQWAPLIWYTSAIIAPFHWFWQLAWKRRWLLVSCVTKVLKEEMRGHLVWLSALCSTLDQIGWIGTRPRWKLESYTQQFPNFSKAPRSHRTCYRAWINSSLLFLLLSAENGHFNCHIKTNSVLQLGLIGCWCGTGFQM